MNLERAQSYQMASSSCTQSCVEQKLIDYFHYQQHCGSLTVAVPNETSIRFFIYRFKSVTIHEIHI